MTVDFTEAAGAGSMAGWKTAAYAPIFHLEPSDCIGRSTVGQVICQQKSSSQVGL